MSKAEARVFAALGDPTRLGLPGRLSAGPPRSTTELRADSDLTRQAVTKHPRVLESAGLVVSERGGRETRFTYRDEPLTAASDYLARISARWDAKLGRLKTMVETAD